MKNKKIIYFNNELENDFASNNIKTKKITEDYKYENKNIFFIIFSFLFRYLIAIPVLWFINVFILRVSFKNKGVLKKVKNKGYYIYANHVVPLDPVIIPVMTHPTKFTVITSSHDTFSIHPIVTFLVKSLGAIPVPSSIKMYDNYTKCMSNHIKKKNRVLIYPEAHIWPYYNKIRRFKSSSFRYPVDDNAPTIVMTTTFKKSKIFKKPAKVIYVDGPFYPNKDLLRFDAVNELRDIAFYTMDKRSRSVDNYEYIKYIDESKNS